MPEKNNLLQEGFEEVKKIQYRQGITDGQREGIETGKNDLALDLLEIIENYEGKQTAQETLEIIKNELSVIKKSYFEKQVEKTKTSSRTGVYDPKDQKTLSESE